MRKIKLRYLVLIFSLLIMMSGISLAYSVQLGFGIVEVYEVGFQAVDGSYIHSTLQRPTYATASNPLPGVVVIHGSLQSKEWLMAFGIELARRGFVVLTIDANGHGNSDPGTGSGTVALEYIASLDFVDDSQLGIIGHSMGGGISWRAIENSELTVRAIALVGSGVRSSANATYPYNILVAAGDFDELSYPLNLTYLETSFGVSPVEPGITYGNFNDGTARRLVFARTNHLFVTVDSFIVSETVEWMKNSLKGEEDQYWIPQQDLIFPLWLVGGFIGILGLVLTIFPLLAILIDLSIFSDLKRTYSTEYAASTRTYLGLGAIYGAIGVGLFFPLLAVGTLLDLVLDFPQYRAIPVLTWIVGCALIAALVLFFVVRRYTEKGVSWRKLWKISDEGSFIPVFMKTFLLGLLVTFWLYGWTLLVDLGLALDFRSFLPGLNDLTPIRTVFIPLYFVFFFIYFLVDGIWLAGMMRRKPRDTWIRTQLMWTIESMFIKCIPYVIILSIQMGIGFLTGYPLAQDLIGYSLLFFFAFTPWFAVAAVIGMYCYQLTNRYYLGAILNAMLFSWMLATILPF